MLPITTLLRQRIIHQLQRSSNLVASVKAEQSLPIALEELPAIRINLDKASVINDWSATNTKGQLLEMVQIPVIIKITAASNTMLEAKLEQLGTQVCQSLVKNETLGGLIKSLRLEEEAEISISHEGEQPIGVLTMRFIVLYRRHVFELNTTVN